MKRKHLAAAAVVTAAGRRRSISGGLYATVTLDATARIAGQTTPIYSGTCTLGTAANPIALTLTTDPPGVPYSQSTGVVTLSSAITAPSLTSCDPAIPSAYAALLDLRRHWPAHLLRRDRPDPQGATTIRASRRRNSTATTTSKGGRK